MERLSKYNGISYTTASISNELMQRVGKAKENDYNDKIA
jgi:hypothetical protein